MSEAYFLQVDNKPNEIIREQGEAIRRFLNACREAESVTLKYSS